MVASIFAVALASAPPALAGNPRHAAMAIDANTGEVLHNEDGDEARHPASLTKMMTLYLAFETIEAGRMTPSTHITISPNAANAPPSKLGLDAGDEITVLDAIKVLITKSANDIAIALAEKIGGTHANFVQLMNTRARELGMSKTRFKNASGLPDPEQVTSARDMITLALHLQDDYPAYYPLFATRSITVAGKTMRNHNTLMNSFQGIDGIKTGYTRMSGFNLVSSVRRGGRHIVAAVFGGSSAATRNGEMRVLLTKSLARGGTQKTRRLAPALIARLKTGPKIAMRQKANGQSDGNAKAIEPSKVKPFAPPSIPTAVAAADQIKPTEITPAPRRAPRVIASLDVVPAAVRPQAPVEIFKVKRVLLGQPAAPIVAAKPLDADMTTDMESLIEATAGVGADSAATEPSEGTMSDSMTIASLAAGYTAAANTTTIIRTPAAVGLAPAQLPETAQTGGLMTVGLTSPPPRAPAPTTLTNAPQAEPSPIAMLGASDVAPPVTQRSAQLETAAFTPTAAPVNVATPGRAPSTLHAQASGIDRAPKSSNAAAIARIDIQIGAFGSADEARQALANVQSRAGTALAGAASVTQPVEKDGRMLYRARFSGLDASRAANACTELRRQSIDCFVMASR